LPFATAHADTFGSGGSQFTMGFVNIGDPGNAADSNGRGAVAYEYRMGVNEVSRGMIDAYNALSGEASLTMSDMSALGGNGTARPATGISWNEAARFVNWLNTSKGFGAAYKFTTGGANDNVEQWNVGDSGFDPSNPFRNANARYYIPSLTEWYKAAYYDPSAAGGTGGYWNFATGSDSTPTAVASGNSPGTAVFGQSFGTGPADVTQTGGLSPFGTMGQNGNVHEWAESYIINTSSEVQRAYWGGTWSTSASILAAQTLLYTAPTSDSSSRGFRVAAVVPEPSGLMLALMGVTVALVRRR
jgi:formylglycine-generating enzyme required for sulfatase activity